MPASTALPKKSFFFWGGEDGERTRISLQTNVFENVTPGSLPPQQLQVLLNSLFKVLLQLSLAVLVCYRSFVRIFSLGWNLPPVLGLHSQTTRLGERKSGNTVPPEKTKDRQTGF